MENINYVLFSTKYFLKYQVKHDHSLKKYIQNKKRTHSNKSAKIDGGLN